MFVICLLRLLFSLIHSFFFGTCQLCTAGYRANDARSFLWPNPAGAESKHRRGIHNWVVELNKWTGLNKETSFSVSPWRKEIACEKQWVKMWRSWKVCVQNVCTCSLSRSVPAICVSLNSICCSCAVLCERVCFLLEQKVCIICKLLLSVHGVLAYLQPQWKQEEITFLQSVWQGKIFYTFSIATAGHLLWLKCFAEGH